MEALLQKLANVVRIFIQQRLAPIINRLTKGRLHPDAVTLFGAFMHIPIAILIALQYNLWAAVLLVFFGLFDSLDGALARLQGRSNPSGMLLDSSTDRVKEIFLYVGAAYAFIDTTTHHYLVVWAVAACGCSLLVSYVNAWGEAVVSRYHISEHTMNKTFRGGLMSFEIRMLVFVLGLLTNLLPFAIIIITIGASYTALSRFLKIFNRLRRGDVTN